MSVSPELAAIWREEARYAMGSAPSAASFGSDLAMLFGALTQSEARTLAVRIIDICEAFLVATEPTPATDEPTPAPAGNE